MNHENPGTTVAPLDDRAAGWIRAFRRTHGRPPRMLHIGNIANNAYNNAKLLIDLGMECDVLCFDYYHIMACPEWEDADFVGTPRDHFFPDWSRVDLNGFQRPDWFIQGPLRECMDFLIARHALRITLEVPPPNPNQPSLWARWRLSRVQRAKARLTMARRRALSRRRRAWLQFLGRLSAPRPPVIAPRQWYPRGLRRAARHAVGHFLEGMLRLVLAVIAVVAVAVELLKIPLRAARKSLPHRRGPDPVVADEYDFDCRVLQLIEEFARQFPDRADQFKAGDVEVYRGCIAQWRTLFRHYDIIQGYSTDGIYPLLADHAPYFAFEHGTLREIPFLQTGQGRAAALTYRMADHAFVTNADCLDNAHRLADDRITFLNHPYDEDHGLRVEGWQELRRELQRELRCEHLILYPTRHDWVHGTGYADKANDVMLRAFERLRGLGCRVGMVCCAWGSNVAQSRELLERLGCAGAVRWVEPMGVVQFDRAVRACHVVADQFLIGAFGGVLFKALANGTPACTYLDVTAMDRHYEEPPPVLNCRTDEEIVRSLTEVFENPALLTEFGRRSREWMKRHHRGKETAAKQVLQYARVIAPELLTEPEVISPTNGDGGTAVPVVRIPRTGETPAPPHGICAS